MNRPSDEKCGSPSQPLFEAVTSVIVPPVVETRHTAVSVLHDSIARAGPRVKARVLPSGEKSNIPPPPNENGGASKSPGVKSTAFVVPIEVRKICARLPSRHSFQCR